MSERRRLSPSDISFHNFDGYMEEVARVLQYVGVRSEQPTVEVVEDGIIVPDVAQPHGPFKFQGGILDADGIPVESAHLRRGGRGIGGLALPLTVEPVVELDEDVVYLGWLQAYHYGLFLLESLSRAWFLPEVDPSTRVAFHQVGRYPPAGASRRILDLMGVPPERMIISTTPMRARRVFVPEALFELYTEAHDDMVNPFREVAAQIMGSGSGKPSEQPVYLSRGRLTSDRRIIIGEAELEQILRDNGFLVVYPENLSLDEQVRLFNDHTDIFACAGSAAHTVLFTLGHPRLHLLTTDVPAPEFFIVALISGAELAFINCLQGEDNHTFPRMLDLPPIVQYLTEHEFIGEQPDEEMAALQADVQERYHQALVFGRIRQYIAVGHGIPAEIEEEAQRLAETSWPISWGLARYYAVNDQVQSAAMARQFVRLLDEDDDPEKVAHHLREVLMGSLQVIEATAAAGGVAAVSQLVASMLDHNMLNVTVQRRAKQIIAEATLAPSGADSLAAPDTVGGAMRRRSVLVANIQRIQLLSVLPVGGVVAEVGTAGGAFAGFIRRTTEPRQLHLIDPWGLDADDPYRGASGGSRRMMQALYERVQQTFATDIETGRVVLHRHYSTEAAASFPDQTFDWVYLDAMRDYASVLADLQAFKDKVKPAGFILGYGFSRHADAEQDGSGVMAAVREFVASEGLDLILVTNEDHPTYLLARSDNATTLPRLKDALFHLRAPRPIEIDASYLDHFEQTATTVANDRTGHIFKFT